MLAGEDDAVPSKARRKAAALQCIVRLDEAINTTAKYLRLKVTKGTVHLCRGAQIRRGTPLHSYTGNDKLLPHIHTRYGNLRMISPPRGTNGDIKLRFSPRLLRRAASGTATSSQCGKENVIRSREFTWDQPDPVAVSFMIDGNQGRGLGATIVAPTVGCGPLQALSA